MRKLKQLNYSIYIRCEGENTEPSFARSLVQNIENGSVVLNDLHNYKLSFEIKPQPKIEEELQVEPQPNKHKEFRNKRSLKGEPEPSFPIPLNFIKDAQEALRESGFNEAWVLFDHDNHPAREKAFAAAQEIIEGKQVNIAFSSIAIEYYFLLHFEYNNCAFEKSECREGKTKLMCGTNVHPDDCHGAKCIGGYAREKKYWDNSKTIDSMYPLLAPRLELGFVHCAKLMHESNIANSALPIYNRNPYTNVDAFVKRFTNNNYQYIWIDIQSINFSSLQIGLSIKDGDLWIKNNSESTIVIAANCLRIFADDFIARTLESSRIILDQLSEVEYFEKLTVGIYILEHNTNKFCFEIK